MESSLPSGCGQGLRVFRQGFSAWLERSTDDAGSDWATGRYNLEEMKATRYADEAGRRSSIKIIQIAAHVDSPSRVDPRSEITTSLLLRRTSDVRRGSKI